MNKRLSFMWWTWFCCGLLYQTTVDAQTTLPYDQTITISTLTSDDYIIPEGITSLSIEVRGADGGNARLNGLTCDVRVRGGQGATMKATFAVGSGDDELKPGGVLRVFAGRAGQNDDSGCSPVPVGRYGAGGGSSAIVYRAQPDEELWQVLAISGGGGGGARQVAGSFRDGKGGADSENGSNTGASLGGSNGSCGESNGNGYGGSGFACSVAEQGSTMVSGYALDNGALAVALRDNSFASETGGKTGIQPIGGDGFTGGATGAGGGGGGGGYSGGAGDNGWQGGGGGSHVTPLFTPTNVTRQAGASGAATNIPTHGVVRITTPELICPVGDVSFNSQQELNDFALNFPNCTEIAGNLIISGTDIVDLSPLSNIATVQGNLGINGTFLTSLTGLSNVSTIGGTFGIVFNDLLTSVEGLSNLQSVGNDFRVVSNESLSIIDDLGQLNYVGGNVEVFDNPELTDFAGWCPFLDNGTLAGEFFAVNNGVPFEPADCLCLVNPPPSTASCNANVTVELDANGQGELRISDVDDGSMFSPCVEGGRMILEIGPVSLPEPFILDCNTSEPLSVNLVLFDDQDNVLDLCSSTISILDVTPPVINVEDVTLKIDKLDGLVLPPFNFLNGINDNCSENIDVTVDPPIPFFYTCSDLGDNPMTITATDESGNTSSKTVVITIEDASPPSAILNPTTVQLDANREAFLTVDELGFVFDVCGIQSVIVEPNTFNCFDVGENTVSVTVTDISGNETVATTTVTVEDNPAITEECTCPPGDITLTTQAEVEEFRAKYPDCTNLPGTLEISSLPNQQGAITDLSPLSNLESIRGTLSIFGNQQLTSFSGLNNLRSVGDGLQIYENNALVELDGFDQLESVGEDLFILTHPLLEQIETFGELSSIGGDFRLVENPNLMQVNGFSNVTALKVLAIENTGLTDLQFLSALTTLEGLGIADNLVLQNLGGLEQIQHLDIGLQITRNTLLENIDALSNLESAGQIVLIQENDALTNVDGLFKLLAVEGQVAVYDNPVLTRFDGLCPLFTIGTIGGDQNVFDNGAVFDPTVDCECVLDTTLPTALCKDVEVSLDANGQGTVTPADLDNGSFDDCGSLSFSLSTGSDLQQLDYSCADLNTVSFLILEVTDDSDNSSTCFSLVTIVDQVAPQIACTDVTVSLNENGAGAIYDELVGDQVTDNCGGSSITGDGYVAFDCNDVGETFPYTFSATDKSGNTTTCTINVAVVDQMAPTAQCKDLEVSLDANGLASITPADINNGSFDNCGSVSFLLSTESGLQQVDFSCADLGTFPSVLLEVTDQTGNSSTCFSEVTVVDNTAPTLSCKSFVWLTLDETGNATLDPQSLFTSSGDNCGITLYNLSQSEFSCEDLGIVEVSLTAQDQAGNISNTCSAEIAVFPNTPSFEFLQIDWVALDENGQAILNIDEVAQLTAGVCNDVLKLTFQDGGIAQTFTCQDIGEQYIEIVVTRQNGEEYAQGSITITVVETIPPTALCKDVEVSLDANGQGSVTTADIDNGSTDNCGITSLALDDQDFSCTHVGNLNTVTLTVTDASGNSGTCTANVIVTDDIAPTLTCPEDMVANTDAGECGAYVSLPKAAPFDNCGIKNLKSRYRAIDEGGTAIGAWYDWDGDQSGFFGQGFYQIQWRAMDESDNEGFCSFTLEVKDEEAPEVSCQDITINFNGEENIAISSTSIFNQTASFDACGEVSFVSQSLSEVNCEDVGEILVVEVVGADPHGNTSTCTSLVTVEGLPCDFETIDIDCPDGASGDYDATDESFTLTANDCIGYPQGAFSWLGSRLCGDGEIVAEVTSLSGDARVGVVMMESQEHGARLVSIVKDFTPRVRTEYRSSTGGSLSHKRKNRTGVDWLRIVRTGNKFKTYTSTNGSYWKLAHTINFPNFEDCIYVGLILYNKNGDDPVTATFENVKITGESADALSVQPSIPASAAAEAGGQPMEQGLQPALQLEAFPNPFSEQLTIRYATAKAGQVDLAVFNLQGQLVRMLYQGQTDTGEQQLQQWGGTDSSGHLLPAGMYLIQLKTGEEVVNQKVLLQR